MNKFRKKGSVFIEYLVVLPIFMLMLWTISQLILYSISSSTAHEAALYGSDIVATEMRGTTKHLNQLDPTIEQGILDAFNNKTSKVLQFNKFLLLYTDINGNLLSNTDIKNMTIIEDETACSTAIADTTVTRVICIYTKGIISDPSDPLANRNHEQIVVKLKMPFKIVGDFIPGLQDHVFVHASGSSAIDVAGRYQPYYSN